MLKLFMKSTYRRMMVVYLAAMLLLYLFSIMMYRDSINSLKKEMTGSVSLIENNYLDRMEQNVVDIKNRIAAGILKQDWSLLATKRGPMRNYDTLQLVLHGQERLQAIKSISDFVADVKAHFAFWGKTISAQSGLLDLQKDEYDKIAMPLDAGGAQFVYEGDDIYLTSAYKFKTPDRFSIVASVDRKEIALSLSELETSAKSRTILVSNETGRVVAASGEPEPGLDAAMLLERAGSEPGAFTMKLDGIETIFVHDYSGYLGFTIINMLPTAEIYKPLKIYYVLTRLFSAAVLIVIGLVVFSTYRMFGKPMLTLVNAFRRMEKGNFGVRLESDKREDFAYLYGSFNRMAGNIQHLVNEVYEKEILVQRANLKQLQAQINPHFLYNSFYILSRMIKLDDNENAARFSAFLGTYFKYVTRDAQDEVPLALEVEHAKAYAGIMAIRFADKIGVTFDPLPERFAELAVPRMLLQPLLENAFEHGVKEASENGAVAVSFAAEEGDLIVTVEDSGIGMPGGKLEELRQRLAGSRSGGEVTGMVNIHRRVGLMYGPGYGMTIGAGKSGGLAVSLRLRAENREG